jgi:signal transduction histidine kinase
MDGHYSLPKKILFADADAAFTQKASERFISLGETAFHLESARSGPEFLDRAFSYPYDLIFLDAALPEASPLDLLEKLFQTTLPMPLVILSPRADARLAVEAMKRGALDFVVKDDFLNLDLAGFLRRLGETSRLRRENAELQQIDQMKNDFLATISHELRTPLTSILGLSEILASGRLGALDKPQEEGLHKIVDQSHALVRLINQLLDVRSFSREETREEPQVVSLKLLVGESVEAHRKLFKEKEVDLEVVCPSDPVEVTTRRSDLRKVFDHLLSNALKFTPRGGRVTVAVSDQGRKAEVRVSDTGRGIPTESLRFLFRKFFHADQSLTRDTGGMGLGLAFCKEAVESMGGRIRAESEGAGRGASVIFTLPRHFRPEAGTLGPKTVLWVDDNPNMLDMVELGFSGLSRPVGLRTARGGLPALEMLKTLTPDLVVLDIMMADMDGLEVLTRLKAEPRTATIPVLIVSGYKEAARTAVQRGANDYCLKPFRVVDVVAKIDTLLFPSR